MANRFEQSFSGADEQPVVESSSGDQLMAALGLASQAALPGHLFYDGLTAPAVSNSEAITTSFNQRLQAARRPSFIYRKYGSDDLSAAEISEFCKAETWRYLEALPAGTQLVVMAAPDCFITVFDSAGYPDKLLVSPASTAATASPSGVLLGNSETFTVGDDNLRIDFSSRDEAVLIDDTKSVILTFHDPNPHNRRSEEVPDYQLFVKLPDSFECTANF